MGESMSFDVFISYSTKDAVAAKAACAALESRKIRCWMAPRDIVGGAKWGASIVRAINECRVMVLIFSGNANESAQVQREVDQAFSKSKTVVPLRIEDVKPADDLAYYLNTVHWLDALTPPLEKNLEQLVATVGALVLTTGTSALVEEPDAHEAARADAARAADEQRLKEAQAPESAERTRHEKEAGAQAGAHSTPQQPKLEDDEHRAAQDMRHGTADAQALPREGQSPESGKRIEPEGVQGSLVVRTSGAVSLLAGLIIVTLIAVGALIANALPSQEEMASCTQAGGSGGGCGGNPILYVGALAVIIAAWRCALWIWRRR
jgi:hypothetical protein